ncbi:MAG: CinA family protein [Chloroflexota bacterium]|nr:CinA family protein [Chloroflexota bacterium]
MLSHDRTTIIATSDQSLPPEETIRHLLDSRTGVTIATAESCTGGLVVARLTSVPGSSGYMKGGIVAYANVAKEQLLGVPKETLANPGAVSEECAIAMAEGARDRLGATWAISTTGIAGPDGGTDRKPVGLVYIGLAGPDGTTVERYVFPGDRHAIVTAACDRALAMLVEAVADVDST